MNEGANATTAPQMENLINIFRENANRLNEAKNAIVNKVGRFNAKEFIGSSLSTKEDKKPEHVGLCGELQKISAEMQATISDLELVLKELSHIVG